MLAYYEGEKNLIGSECHVCTERKDMWIQAHMYWFWQDTPFKWFYYAYYFKYSIAFRYTSNYWNLWNNDYVFKNSQ